MIVTPYYPLNVRRARQERAVSFVACIWVIVAAMIVIGLWPVAKGVIAKQTWTKVPCYLNEEKSRYFYTVNGANYYSERFDFWDSFHKGSNRTLEPVGKPNAECYVDKNDSSQAIFYVDSYKRAAGIMSGLQSFTLLIVAASGLTFLVRRSARQRAQKPRPESTGAMSG